MIVLPSGPRPGIGAGRIRKVFAATSIGDSGAISAGVAAWNSADSNISSNMPRFCHGVNARPAVRHTWRRPAPAICLRACPLNMAF
jgi:hypothetical protein